MQTKYTLLYLLYDENHRTDKKGGDAGNALEIDYFSSAKFISKWDE